MRILVFGDSIAHGAWDVGPGGWVERVREAYDRQFVAAAFEGDDRSVYNLSVSGNTTGDLLQRFASEARARLGRHGEPIAIIFAIGTNDAQIINGTPRTESSRYADNIAELLAQARAFTDASRLVVAGLPACDEARTTPVAWRPSLHFTNERLEHFEQVARRVAETNGVAFAPVFDAFRKRQGSEALLADGLHPNSAGHKLIYEQLKPCIDRLRK